MIVIFSAHAKAQLREMRSYIARESGYPERANAYVQRIVVFCKKLDMFPERGTRRDDIFSGLRVIGFEGRVIIAFYVMEEEVLIEGIFYGGQDIDAFYSDET
jgi:plasmid stabilization system protein ParE